MVKAVELKDKAVNVPAIGGTEVENILGAAQEDAASRSFSSSRRANTSSAKSLSPSAPYSSRTR
jgi:hypothetical protein